jgi:hypothetical protein
MSLVYAARYPYPHSLPTRGREACSEFAVNSCPQEAQSSPSPLWGEIKGGGDHV